MLAFRTAHVARDARRRSICATNPANALLQAAVPPGRFPISETVLRREVANDLDSLMNTVALESTEDLTGFAHVRTSILNFGFPDIAHRSIDEISVDDLKDEIRTLDDF